MADSGVYDRWYQTIDGKRVRSAEHGQGKRWQARWRDNSGPGGTVRQRKRNFDRKVEAEQFLAKVKADLARGGYIDPAASRTTLRAYATTWLQARTSDPSTQETLKLHVGRHILPALGDYQLGAILPSTIQAWLRGLQATLAPGSVRVILSDLSSILGAAVDDGLIPRNECHARSVQAPARERRKVVPWTLEQAAAVRAALPGRYQAMVDVGAGLGLRQGEMLGLEVGDVDFLRGVVHVRRQVKIVGGKLHFALPKRGKERDVPLPSSVALRLAAHLQAWPALQVTLPRLPGGKGETRRLVFTTRDGNAVARTHWNAGTWKVALRAAGVPTSRENGCHVLRHTYASVVLEAGVSIRALADYLGHDDPGFTLRIYTHMLPQAEDRTRAAVDAALGEAAGAAGALDVPSEGR
jgi:integrase